MHPQTVARCLLALAVFAHAAAADEQQAVPVTDQPTHPAEVWGLYPELTPVPGTYVLTNRSTLGTLTRVATPGRSLAERAIIFTTLRLGDAPAAEVIEMIASFCAHLHRQGLLPHTMLITTDESTWETLHARGLPVFLDRAFPRRSAYVERVLPGDTHNREFDVQKHWWGWRMASLGFRVLYMDSDAMVVSNPLAAFDEPFDVQVGVCLCS
jgi:hypothetical protein